MFNIFVPTPGQGVARNQFCGMSLSGKCDGSYGFWANSGCTSDYWDAVSAFPLGLCVNLSPNNGEQGSVSPQDCLSVKCECGSDTPPAPTWSPTPAPTGSPTPEANSKTNHSAFTYIVGFSTAGGIVAMSFFTFLCYRQHRSRTISHSIYDDDVMSDVQFMMTGPANHEDGAASGSQSQL
jgi:hypothetical protein